MFGEVKLEEFKNLAKMPQDAANAWQIMGNLVGCEYKPVLFVGKQLVNGTNYIFIAEQKTVTLEPRRHLVKIVINQSLKGEYSLVKPLYVIA